MALCAYFPSLNGAHRSASPVTSPFTPDIDLLWGSCAHVLSEDGFDHLAVHIGEAVVATLELESQFLVIDPE